MNKNNEFKILTVGWAPWFIDFMIAPIEKKTGIKFLHGLVGSAEKLGSFADECHPSRQFIELSISNKDSLPPPDLALLASLESRGVPTVKSMIQGDRVLRNRSERESLSYATFLARSIEREIKKNVPDLILASHDSLHSAMSLAVAKLLGVPWVAMTYTVIPDNLTAFCNALTPNSLVPIVRQVDDELRSNAHTLILRIREKSQQVLAYRAPASIAEWVRQYGLHTKNLICRMKADGNLDANRYIFPTPYERLYDIMRRTFNRSRLPTKKMLWTPPGQRYAYYPLHMAPESMIDTWAPFYQNQLAFVAQLSLAIPADMMFIVKLHFSDPDNYSRRQLERLMKMPNLRIAHPNALGSIFIENSALVVGITGTSCLEAALLGKPVLIFGDTPYVNFPRSERAKEPDKLYVQILRMLDQSPPSDEEIIEAYATYMARFMPGRINDWNRPIMPDEMERYSACFEALRNYLAEPNVRSNWYANPPFSKVS